MHLYMGLMQVRMFVSEICGMYGSLFVTRKKKKFLLTIYQKF